MSTVSALLPGRLLLRIVLRDRDEQAVSLLTETVVIKEKVHITLNLTSRPLRCLVCVSLSARTQRHVAAGSTASIAAGPRRIDRTSPPKRRAPWLALPGSNPTPDINTRYRLSP